MKIKKILFLFCLLGSFPLSCSSNSKNHSLAILFTNDIHGEINHNLSYAHVAKMKKDLRKNYQNVLLFDSGDFLSGGIYCDSHAGDILDIMSSIPYDGATIGNHEFDYGIPYLKESIKNHASFPFVSSNFYNYDYVTEKETTPVFDNPTHIYTFDNFKVGLIGVTSIGTINHCNPSFFKDKNGNLIYTFQPRNFYQKIQNDIDNLRKECDYVIGLFHVGDAIDIDINARSSTIINNVKGLDFVIDGHSHETYYKKIKDKENKDVPLCQLGDTFSNIGVLVLNENKQFDCSFVSYYSSYDENIQKKVDAIIDEVDERFSKVIATSTTDFSVLGHGKKESTIGDFVSESFYYYFNKLKYEESNTPVDVVILNDGGIRAGVEPGAWTTMDVKTILPFNNYPTILKVKASTLRKILEFSYRKAPDEYFGGFFQVAGIKCEIDTGIVSDIKTKADGTYESGPSIEHQRVKNIKIYNKETNQYDDFIENDSKTYNLGGIDFHFVSLGGGYSMFKEGEVLFSDTALYYEAFLKYINDFTKINELPFIDSSSSPLIKYYPNLGIDYKEGGAGRVIIP